MLLVFEVTNNDNNILMIKIHSSYITPGKNDQGTRVAYASHSAPKSLCIILSSASARLTTTQNVHAHHSAHTTMAMPGMRNGPQDVSQLPLVR
jgi:hypothetical protein